MTPCPLYREHSTGEPLELRGINIFRISGDRIVERWGRLDDLGVARQLGLVARTA